MFLTLTYLMGWFSGLLEPYMAAAVTGEVADYQIHQVRFLIAFVLITIGTIAINFNWQLERVFTVIAWCRLTSSSAASFGSGVHFLTTD